MDCSTGKRLQQESGLLKRLIWQLALDYCLPGLPEVWGRRVKLERKGRGRGVKLGRQVGGRRIKVGRKGRWWGVKVGRKGRGRREGERGGCSTGEG